MFSHPSKPLGIKTRSSGDIISCEMYSLVVWSISPEPWMVSGAFKTRVTQPNYSPPALNTTSGEVGAKSLSFCVSPARRSQREGTREPAEGPWRPPRPHCAKGCLAAFVGWLQLEGKPQELIKYLEQPPVFELWQLVVSAIKWREARWRRRWGWQWW